MQPVIQKLSLYLKLMRFNKPIGIFLLLWPVLWALMLVPAARQDGFLIAIFISGVIIMRAAGCIINDFADRKIDGRVARTRSRPLATGQVSSKEALILFGGLILIAFGLVLVLNWLTIIASLVGVLLAVIYPFTKRVTYCPQFVLGAAFAWGVIMVFTASLESVPFYGILLFFATLIWAVIYDTMYAMVDREDDLKIGVKSTAILWGCYDRAIIAFLQVSMLLLLLVIGHLQQLNVLYYISLLIATGLFTYQQFLIKDALPSYCFRAFLNNNWLGLIIFIGIVVGH